MMNMSWTIEFHEVELKGDEGCRMSLAKLIGWKERRRFRAIPIRNICAAAAFGASPAPRRSAIALAPSSLDGEELHLLGLVADGFLQLFERPHLDLADALAADAEFDGRSFISSALSRTAFCLEGRSGGCARG